VNLAAATFARMIEATEQEIDPVALCARLMEIDSTSGREGAVVDWMHAFLSGRDWNVTRIRVSEGRDDLFVTTQEDSNRERVTLSTHLDTVPPFLPPRLENGVLHGRGSCDAKGIAAAMVCAAERLRADRRAVSLLFVVGEEVSHDGAHAANVWARAQHVKSRALINGEPTESTLALGTKGAMRATVRTTGVAAHSAYPALGRSATAELVRLLSELDGMSLPSDPLLGETTINIGILGGGIADNVLAPSAEARLMARLVGDADVMRAILSKWAAGRAELEFGPTVPAMRFATIPGFTTSVVAFATDVPALDAWGEPYLFGPGSIHVAHSEREYINVAELEKAVESYVRLASSILSTA
jgi:acetylornithine deacetylase/succinyl-diaminopimelate desuccinylase-like protein